MNELTERIKKDLKELLSNYRYEHSLRVGETAKELARIIESFLDTLTVENRVIFMCRYWFSDSCKDIAGFMGLSEKNISVRLTRIREKMRKYLMEREVFV